MRRQIVAFALASMLILGLASAGASAASASTMPAEGVFENCSIATEMVTCLQRLETMHAGGVNVVVLPIEWATPSAISTYADVAHSMGMSVMWWMSDQNWWDSTSTNTNMDPYYEDFVTDSGQTQNGPLLNYIVRYLASLPGTYGYYAVDDSAMVPGDGAAIAAYTAQIRAADPNHPVMIGTADQTETDSYQHSANLIGAELYPVTDSSLMPVSSNQGMWDSIAQSATDAQQSADNAGNQSAFILQAFSWGDNLADGEAVGVCTASDTPASCWAKAQYPTTAAQLQLRNEILTHAHPSLILWWSFMGTYGQSGNITDGTFPTGAQAAAQWAGLESVIQAPAPATSGSTPPAKIKKPTKDVKAHAASTKKKTKRHARRRHHRRRHRRHHAVRHRHGRRFLAHAA